MTRQQRRAQQRRQPDGPNHPRKARPWLLALLALATLVTIAAVVVERQRGGVGEGGLERASEASQGLPDTPDYHSLIVATDDPERIFLGTHQGLFESRDGGRSWRQTGAIDGDAMNLARDATDSDVLYAAGHQLFQKSGDGGTTWRDIPLDDAIAETRASDDSGAVDIHGFAADPATSDSVYAAVANRGLYKSTDAGESFTKLSDTGSAGFGIAIADTRPRRIYLADTQQGLLLSTDEARTWKSLQRGVTSVAISPADPDRVLAAGKAIYLSTNGRDFARVRGGPADGFGPVAFAPSDPTRAFAVGYDRNFYVSVDAGGTWTTL